MRKILAGFILDGHGGGVDNYLLNFLENTASEDPLQFYHFYDMFSI